MGTQSDTRRLSLDSLNTPSEDKSRSDDYPPRNLLPTESVEEDQQNTLSWRKRIVATIHLWWLESLACILVVGSLLAIVGTIRPYQDRPIPQWPYHLSINTLVAVYILILKITMAFVISSGLGQLKWTWFRQTRPLDHLERFDDASRGPMGSLKLMWILRVRYWLPSLGAFVAVLAIIVEPFGQQIIHFYSCSIQLPNQIALVSRTNEISTGPGFRIGATLQTLSAGVQNSINGAVFTSQLWPISFTCPTGNCTFSDTYRSAGWCKSCADVSDQIQIATNETSTYYILPSTNLTARPGARSFVMGVDSNASSVIIQAIYATGIDPSSPPPPGPWAERGYGAVECAIRACLRTYNSTVQAGNITETILSESVDWSDPDPDISDYLSTVDVSCLNSNEVSVLHKLGYNFDPVSTLWLPAKLRFYRFDPNLTASGFDVRSECVYQYFGPAISSVSTYFQQVFEGSVVFGRGSIGGPNVLLSIFREGNVTFESFSNVFGSVVQSMTIFGRNYQGVQNASQGQVFNAEVCVDIQWGWILYPAVLVVCTMVFLMGTVIRSGTKNGWPQQDYKTSALPLMFHGLERLEVRTNEADLDNMARMRAAAKGLEIRFQKTNRGWRFVEI